jgi:hypothetical protein
MTVIGLALVPGFCTMACSTSGGRSFSTSGWLVPGLMYVASLPCCVTPTTLTTLLLTRNPTSIPPMSFPSTRYGTYIGFGSPAAIASLLIFCASVVERREVLHFLHGQDVRRAQLSRTPSDALFSRLSNAVAVRTGSLIRIVDGVEEALHVMRAAVNVVAPGQARAWPWRFR